MATARHLIFLILALFPLGCGGSINRNNDRRDNMLYVSAQNDAVIHGYDLEVDPDDSPTEDGITIWPRYRTVTEGVITDMAISADRKWVLAVNDAGAVECFVSQSSGRLTRLPSVVLPEGKATTVAFSPNAFHFYLSGDTGKVFHYQISEDGTMSLFGTPIGGPANASRILVRPDGMAVYVLDKSTSRIWQYSVDGDGNLTPLSPASVDVMGGPAEGLWNAASTQFFVSCQDTDEVALLVPGGGGGLVEQTRLAGPNNPGAPVMDIAELYLCVPSQDGTGQIWRYQASSNFIALDPPHPTLHQLQANALLNPYGFFFVLNRGDDSFTNYRVGENAVLTSVGTKPLELNPGRAVYRVNP